ncbi:DNA-binding CsgD family transcriptional regulator [Catenulispora sp. GP43]|uniref:helix-turn-helix transcriptional regulator n=1 Tax=Catenulispora sp. GP43 TaxID=3156263 RepID=UPI0035141419
MDGSLIGRDRDAERLGDFVAGIPQFGGSLLVVGDPGVGKTALLTAVSHKAEEAGFRVLHTAGHQYRTQVGYIALHQLLSSVPEYRLREDLAAVTGPALDHGAVAEAAVSLITDLSRDCPILLVLDDIQWLDPASTIVLQTMARRLPGTGAGMLCAARTGAESVFAVDGLHELGPLSAAASERLLVRSFPALAPRVRQRLMADAEGNPLALLELPAALTDSQRTASQALPRHLPLTRRLQAAFASRVQGLPAATRHLLLVAALESSGSMQVVRRAVAGRCSLKHLAPAENAGLVVVDDATGRLSFRHSLVRSAVVELSTSEQRRNVHNALAEAHGGSLELRAWHLALACVEPDERVAALLEQVAGIRAARGDGADAVEALVRAADLSPRGTEQARRLAMAAYVGVNLTGRLREVPRLLDAARHSAPEAGSVAAAAATAVYLLNGYGDVDTAHRVLSAAVLSRPEPCEASDTPLVEALFVLLMVCFYGGRPELWSSFDQAMARFASVPDLAALMRAAFGDPVRARPADWAQLDAVIGQLPGTADPVRIVRIGVAAAYADRLGGLEEPLWRTAYGDRAGENVFPAIQALFLLGNHFWFSGQWSQLRRVIADGLDLCELFHYPMPSWPGRFLVACVSAASGDYEGADSVADQLEQWAGPHRAGAARQYAAHIRTLGSLARGDFEAAYDHASSIAPAGSLPSFASHALWVFLDLIEAAVRTGRRGHALAHIEVGRKSGLAEVSPRLRMVLLAGAALAADDDDVCFAGFDEALAVEGADRWPFEQARIHLYFGERLRRGKSSARARHHLNVAAQTFGRLGAAPWADRALQELRACGRPIGVEAQHADSALTPQQWEIARLAASGLTNKQIGEKLFLSPRTVSTHLYQLFPKLGVTSRAALRDALERLNTSHDGSGYPHRPISVEA